jgi:hypothetical protein
MLASDEASYISRATIAVTGGAPIIRARVRRNRQPERPPESDGGGAHRLIAPRLYRALF